jgi:hypothetical protein
LKRSLNPSSDNSYARKKTSVLPADSENGDGGQALKLHGQSLNKAGVHRHESRKVSAEPAVIEVQKDTSEKRVTRTKEKTK